MLKPIWNVLFFAALALFLTSAASANEVFENAERAKQAATDYSAKIGGAGIVISYGRENKVSADALGQSFGKEIKRRGHQSQYFVINGDHVGVSVMYQIGAWNSGWLTVANAAAEMDNIDQKIAVQERIVFLEARMARSRVELIEKYGENYLEEMEKRYLKKDEH
jgi:hypothetical protein